MEGNLGHELPLYPLRKRPSIEQRVAESLRGLIISGHLKEGTPLVQRELATRLGVSQTPVRAGLSQLEREGFVVLGPTGRAVVNRLTREDFEEIYAARYGLEGLAARVGAPAVGPDELERMREFLALLREAARMQDVDAYLGLRWHFYSACYRASGRQRLVAEVERLYDRSERYNRIVLSTPRRFRESVGRYAAFLAACKAQDGAAAERIVQESLSWAVERVAGDLPSEADGE
jgi:DNA-binding GntR family transcriptional regulator